MMKSKAILVASLIVFLSSCGGSSGVTTEFTETSEPKNHYNFSSSSLYQYKNNESINYAVNTTFDHYDSNDKLTISTDSGTITSTFYTGYSINSQDWIDINPLTKRLDVVNTSSKQIINQSYFNYSLSGNYIQFLNGNSDLPSNRDTVTIGIAILPGIFYNGFSWSTFADNYEFDDKVYQMRLNYTVIKKETITTQNNTYDTYKILYTGSGGEWSLGLGGEYVSTVFPLNITGTIWINPEIGVIKRTATYSFKKNNWVLFSTLNENIELTSFSFDSK